ncbi:signal peptidase I [Candidatus Poribacteria bacterium]|nr:signal peptidase I [Candidatus Poribacteria bacterium]
MSDNDTELSKWQKFRKIILITVIALLLVLGFIRLFAVQAFKIPSGAMEDTLLIGDHIFVSKFTYGIKIPGTDIKVLDFHEPARGDVFVFLPPHDRERIFIKRIVAVEGDTVETRGDTLYVNGAAVDDSHYTKHMSFGRFKDFPPFRQSKYLPDAEDFADYTLTASQFRRKFPEGKPFVVPQGMVFAMGDNRDQSSDSRTWGPVDVNDIKGQAFMVYWSFDSRSGKVRFNRIGKLIRSQSDSFKGN